MEYIQVAKENLEKEHICCAISNNKDIQVCSKKAWLAERFDDGLVFYKSVERGKCFIEYIPAENAWIPLCADGYMYIDCLWVSGSFKGHGYSNDLLSHAISDSKEKKKAGLCILSSAKKRAFLAEYATRQTTAFSFGIFPLTKTQRSPALKNVQSTPTQTKTDMFCITQTNVRSQRNMFRLLKSLRRSTMFLSAQFISIQKRTRRTLLPR